MLDHKRLAIPQNRWDDNLTVAMLAASCAAFWCLNIWTMFNWPEGMVLQKVAVQAFAWLHTICFYRHFNR